VSGAVDSLGSDWRDGVTVREDEELACTFSARLPSAAAPRAIAVTDLVAPRRAYWRACAPVPIAAERQSRLDLGRALHRRIGSALATEGALEVRVRREGLVGRIDLLSDLPVEVKTLTRAVDPADWVAARPDQVDQLAMYAALTERRAGRLLTVDPIEGNGFATGALEVGFGDDRRILAAMAHGAAALRQSWRDRTPAALPACRWFGRGCEFVLAKVCDCTGNEAAGGPVRPEDVREVRSAPEFAQRVSSRLQGATAPDARPVLRRFRDLIYPRRACFERTAPAPESEPFWADPTAPADLYERARSAVEGGPVGEVAQLLTRTDGPEEDVGGFRGAPYLLRTSRAWERPTVASLLDRQPQYLLELGFRCVATGTRSALLVLGREREPSDERRIQVFRLEFTAPHRFARLWRERERELAAAIDAAAPERLPPCPEWMVRDCPYGDRCGCGAVPGRSQR
jgi:hypothetical protein